jgi:hypothetical protein
VLQALQGLRDQLEQPVLKALQEILVRQDLLVQQAQWVQLDRKELQEMLDLLVLLVPLALMGLLVLLERLDR